jgi:hypothetical protein
MTINERLNSLADNRFSDQKKRGSDKTFSPTLALKRGGDLGDAILPSRSKKSARQT